MQCTGYYNFLHQKNPYLHALQGNREMGARYLDPKYSRWISVDPALGEYVPGAGKANTKDAGGLPGMEGLFNSVNLNLFHYAANNPVRYVDPDGRKAGDAFNSIEEAAIDWANTYADDSIALNCEFGSTIYSFKTKEGGKNVTKYSYNIPRHGYVKSVKPNDKLEKGQKAVSVIHSHGSLIPGYDEDNPSSEDIKAAKEKNWIEYLVTPYGNLKSFDRNGIIRIIKSDLKKDGCITEDGTITFSDHERHELNKRYYPDKYIR